MKRTPIQRSTALSRGTAVLVRRSPLRARRRERVEVDAAVWRADLGSCVVCDRPAEHGHHAIPKRLLRSLGLTAFLSDVRNRVPMCAWDHESHETRSRPLSREELPVSVFEFADQVGLGWYIDRHYQRSKALAA